MQNRRVTEWEHSQGAAALLTAVVAGLLAMGAYMAAFGQASPTPDATAKAQKFPDKLVVRSNPHQHEAIAIMFAIGYTNDYNNIGNYYQGIYISSSSSGAPRLNFGDSLAESIASLMDAGYKIQANPQYDSYGWSGSMLLTK